MEKINTLKDSWRIFWSCTLLLIGITLVPFIINDYPGLADYSNHLTRLHLLTGQASNGWHEFYSLKFELIPNLALDIIGSYFVELGLSPEVALRVFSAISILLVAAGTYAVSINLNKQPPWLAMWAFIFIFNRYFIWGFLNYFFSLGLAFLIFAFWIATQKSPNSNIQFLSKLAVSLLLMTSLLSHLMGYAIALICIFGYEFGKVLPSKKIGKR